MITGSRYRRPRLLMKPGEFPDKPGAHALPEILRVGRERDTRHSIGPRDDGRRLKAPPPTATGAAAERRRDLDRSTPLGSPFSESAGGVGATGVMHGSPAPPLGITDAGAAGLDDHSPTHSDVGRKAATAGVPMAAVVDGGNAAVDLGAGGTTITRPG